MNERRSRPLGSVSASLLTFAVPLTKSGYAKQKGFGYTRKASVETIRRLLNEHVGLKAMSCTLLVQYARLEAMLELSHPKDAANMGLQQSTSSF